MYDGGFGGGFDWNGNGHRDAGDSYMDYEIMNDKGGGGGRGSGGAGGSGGSGCGCFMMVVMVLGLLYLLGSCS